MASEEKKAKSREKRAAKKEALNKVLSFVKENADGDEDLMGAVKLLTPGQRFGGSVRTGIKDIAAALFLEKEEVSETEAFNELKLGRPGMRKVVKQLISKRDPEDRLWVSFDPESGVYKLVATGKEAPEGWTGYTPVEVEGMEIV